MKLQMTSKNKTGGKPVFFKKVKNVTSNTPATPKGRKAVVAKAAKLVKGMVSKGKQSTVKGAPAVEKPIKPAKAKKVLSPAQQALLESIRREGTVAHSSRLTPEESAAIKAGDKGLTTLLAIGDTGCMYVRLTKEEIARVKLNSWNAIGKGTPFDKHHRSEAAFAREESGDRTGCFFTDSGSIVSSMPSRYPNSIGTGKFWLGSEKQAFEQKLVKRAVAKGEHDGKAFSLPVVVRKSFEPAASRSSYKSGQWRFACLEKGVAGGRIETYAIGDARNIALLRKIDDVVVK